MFSLNKRDVVGNHIFTILYFDDDNNDNNSYLIHIYPRTPNTDNKSLLPSLSNNHSSMNEN